MESEEVLHGLEQREATAKRRLSAFGKTLGGFSREKAARDELTLALPPSLTLARTPNLTSTLTLPLPLTLSAGRP